MSKPADYQPETVSARIKRAGELMRHWGWAELTIWTERMLTALEQGVKGGKWFSLIDKIYPVRTLNRAFSKVAANQGAAGVDHVTIPMFEDRLDEELERLSDQLRSGTDRWGYRRYVTGWSKRHCAWPWNRSLRRTSPSTATAFALAGDAKTRCAESTNCSRPATALSSMPT